MKVISQAWIQPNTGWTGRVEKGQRIRVTGVNIVDFVVFNHDNLRQRLDALRTRGNQSKLYITAGDYIVSKFNRPMMKIVEDTYTEGTHDLEKGMCSGYSYQRKAKLGQMADSAGRSARFPIGDAGKTFRRFCSRSTFYPRTFPVPSISL